MLALSIDNLLFILLIAGAALFQLLSRAVSKAGKSDSHESPESPTPTIPPPIRRGPAESDADRIRKFLEALGQPPSSTPPPPVAPRTNLPPRPLAPVQPPPVTPSSWRLPREQQRKTDITQREIPPGEQPRPKIVAPMMPAPAASEFEVHYAALPVELQQPAIIKATRERSAGATRPTLKLEDFKTDLASLLASKSGLREAFLLREILGPPRGLQTDDLL